MQYLKIMSKIKIFLIFVILSLNSYSYAEIIEIKVKIQDEIITNLDIKNEKKYLFFLNPKLKELEEKKINNIAKNSLINETIKKNELKKYFNFKENEDLINVVEENLLKRKNINNKEEFKSILKDQKIKYENIRTKLYIETLWNQLIYEKYNKNVIINQNELKQNIIEQFNKKEKKFTYNLSEIVFSETIDINLEQKLLQIKESIATVGFENTANIFSISNTSKNGGIIGWVNELQVSKKINEQIKKLKINQITKPIKIHNGYIVLKLNNKKQLEQKIDIEVELNKLINKETNRQLNNFSVIFFKKLKRNIEINEL